MNGPRPATRYRLAGWVWLAGLACGIGTGAARAAPGVPPVHGAGAAAAYDNIPRDLPAPVTIGECIVDDSRVQPTAALPQIGNLGTVYVIELGRWGIHADGTHPQETTSGLNAAIAWASQQGYGTVHLPAGLYRVGQVVNSLYVGGVILPGHLHFELAAGATIQMMTTDHPHYCVVDIPDGTDVKISGGTVLGDRPTHVYAGGGTHEFGMAICVGSAGGSDRILIESMTLADAIGDGVIINDAPGVSRNVTIRNNNIHHHRRQGVSIIGGVDIVIENNQIHHIAGTDPQFGVDIEATLGDNQNRNILIRGNAFYQNQGGDYVNTGGRNVWLVQNTLDQTGLSERQGNGPIIVWHKTDQVIRGNTITTTVGSSNGQWALVSYPLGANPLAPTLIEDNIFHGGGINVGGGTHESRMTYVRIAGNVVHDHNFVVEGVPCTQFDNNEVIDDGQVSWPYIFHGVYGRAAGNRRDGAPMDLLLSPDVPYDHP